MFDHSTIPAHNSSMKAHVVSPSLTSAVPDLSRSQSSSSQNSVQIKTPIQEIEKARNDEDDVADGRGKRKRLRLDKVRRGDTMRRSVEPPRDACDCSRRLDMGSDG